MTTLEHLKKYGGFQLTFSNYKDAQAFVQAFAGATVQVNNSDMINEWEVVVANKHQGDYDPDVCSFAIICRNINNRMYSATTGRCLTKNIVDAINARGL